MMRMLQYRKRVRFAVAIMAMAGPKATEGESRFLRTLRLTFRTVVL
jgi:hypothetical protein